MPQPGSPTAIDYPAAAAAAGYGTYTPTYGTGEFPHGGGTGGEVTPAPDPYTTTIIGTPTGTGQIGGGGNVDWASLIGGSYEVAQAEAMMAQQMARARDAFTGDLRSAFINLGYTGDQSQLGNLSSYLDQGTIQQAINNKYSIYNQIKENSARANAVNNATLAARGILSSGQTSKSATDVLRASEQSRYDALRSFLQQGSQGLMHIGDIESQMAQGLMQARFAAAQRLAAMYPMGGGPQPTAPAGGGGAVSAAPSYVPPTWIQMGDQGYVPVSDSAGNLTPWLNTGWMGPGWTP